MFIVNFDSQRVLRRKLIVVSCIFYVPAVYSFDQNNSRLEEIIVTAQKREQKMQDTPISMSVLQETELTRMGVNSLDGLKDSVIPSLRISPNGNTASSLTIGIRGDGPSDVVQTQRETPVAVYVDGIYLGRAQGLNMEFADLKRIEVLRGPQGTLFGRNSTSGAVSLITNKPSGEWGVKQTLTTGSYNLVESVTRINTSEIANIRAKLDYAYSDIDGWVKNRGAGQANYNESKKQGGTLSINWTPAEDLELNYRYENARIESTQNYFQMYGGNTGAIGPEKSRETKTRVALALEPSVNDIKGHSVIAEWSISDQLTIKSLSAYRDLDEDGSNNYGGVLSAGGIILEEDIRQEQYSQELQLIGAHNSADWVAGLFYFKEDTEYDLNLLFSLTPQPTIPPVSNPAAPPSFVRGSSESMAIFGHGTYAVTEQLNFTLGARYTTDEKTASRNSLPTPGLDSENLDGTISLSYAWSDSVTTYLKWSTAYKAGGYNSRSVTFSPYDEETNQTYEIGMKSDWLDQRLRFNIAAFKSDFKDKQTDFADPNIAIFVETLNAIKDVKIRGAEIDLTAIPVDNLELGLSYTYLDGDMPLQPHPDFPGDLQKFDLIQTPTHAGSLTADYTLPESEIGTLSIHFDATSTSRYAHSTVPTDSQDSYTLLNARVSLDPPTASNFSIALWGRNLANEEYASLRFLNSATGSLIQSFGMPRTFGIDFSYIY
jgi:iron complex outermembrane recepter protein